MAWLILILAGLCETGMVMGLHFAAGFTRFWPSVFTAVAGLISFYLLSVAMKTIPVGTAYAIWTAIGASCAVILGIVLLREPLTVLRIVGIGIVLGGVVVLRLAESSAA
jgi:quaternary ammonium compound-resistance protein SugE